MMGNHTSNASVPTYTLDQIKSYHNQYPEQCWVIYRKGIYDVTQLLESHAGGAQVILNRRGQDTTDLFDDMHTESSREVLKEFLVGKLSTE